MLKQLLKKKKCWRCSRCGYRSFQKIKNCPTCNILMEEECCRCLCTKSSCICKKC